MNERSGRRSSGPVALAPEITDEHRELLRTGAPLSASQKMVLFQSQLEHEIPLERLPTKVKDLVIQISQNRRNRVGIAVGAFVGSAVGASLSEQKLGSLIAGVVGGSAGVAVSGKSSLELHRKLETAIRDEGIIIEPFIDAYHGNRWAQDFAQTHPYAIVRGDKLVLLKNTPPVVIDGMEPKLGQTKLDKKYLKQRDSKLREIGVGGGFHLIKIGDQKMPAPIKPHRRN